MNYGDIKTHFEALLNRSDITNALTTTFVEQGIARIQRSLRSPMNENIQTYSLVAGAGTPSITLPSDFLQIISVYYSGNQVERIPLKKFLPYTQNSYTGTPQFFTRQQQTLLLHPQPDGGDLTLYYYGELPAMVADTDENALAAVAPDLIIYAALTYAADYYLDERAELFELKFQQFLEELELQAEEQELSGGVSVIQPSYDYNDYMN